MLDWLSSKVAMTLAALLLLAGVVGFFAAQRGHAVRDALDSIARAAAAYIDEVSRSSGEVTTSLAVGPPSSGDSEGLELPAMAAGVRYALTVHVSSVSVEGDGHRAIAGLRAPVHLWRPEARPYAAGDIAAMDAGHPGLAVGGSVSLVRRTVEIDGQPSLETFLFS